MKLGTLLYTFFYGNFVGEDEFGNKYFESKKIDKNNRHRRWVKYNGEDEASKVPAMWHGWLHHTIDEVPTQKYKWQKPHQQNMTGTKLAYFPKGHINSGAKRAKATGDYQAWKPGE